MAPYCDGCGKPQNRKQEKSLLTGWRSSVEMERELICLLSVRINTIVVCMCV